MPASSLTGRLAHSAKAPFSTVLDDPWSQTLPVSDWDAHVAQQQRPQVGVALCNSCTSRWIKTKARQCVRKSNPQPAIPVAKPVTRKDENGHRGRPLWRPSGLAGLDKLKQSLPVWRGRAVQNYASGLPGPARKELMPENPATDQYLDLGSAVDDGHEVHGPMVVNLLHPESSGPSSPSRDTLHQRKASQQSVHQTSQPSMTVWGPEGQHQTSQNAIPVCRPGSRGQESYHSLPEGEESHHPLPKAKGAGVVVDAQYLRAGHAAWKARHEQICDLKKELTKSLFSTFPREELSHHGLIEGMRPPAKKAVSSKEGDKVDKLRSHRSFLKQLTTPLMQRAKACPVSKWGENNLQSVKAEKLPEDEIVDLPKSELSPEEDMMRKVAKSAGVSILDVEDVFEQYMTFLGAHNVDALLRIGPQSRRLLKVLKPNDPRTKAAADELEALMEASKETNPDKPAEKVEFGEFYLWFIQKFPLKQEEKPLPLGEDGVAVRRSGWGGVSVHGGNNAELFGESLGLADKMVSRPSGLSQDTSHRLVTATLDAARNTVTVANSLPALGDVQKNKLMLTDVEPGSKEQSQT